MFDLLLVHSIILVGKLQLAVSACGLLWKPPCNAGKQIIFIQIICIFLHICNCGIRITIINSHCLP